MKSDWALLVCGDLPSMGSFKDPSCFLLMSPASSRTRSPIHHPEDGKREWKLVGGLHELGQKQGLIAPAHVPLAEPSHKTARTAKDAGKYSQAVCPGIRGSGFGEYLVHLVPNFPGPSNGSASREEFLDTACSAKNNQKKDFSALAASSLFPQCTSCSMDILAQVGFAPLWIWLSQ